MLDVRDEDRISDVGSWDFGIGNWELRYLEFWDGIWGLRSGIWVLGISGSFDLWGLLSGRAEGAEGVNQIYKISGGVRMGEDGGRGTGIRDGILRFAVGY